MCGLVGFFSKDFNYDQNKIKYLLLDNEKRGKDSTGLFIKNSTGEHLVKYVGAASENLLPNVKFPNECFMAIGHTRAKTQGLVNKENAHPFRYGNIVGAHNGRITNAWSLCSENGLKSSDYDVDSMVIYALMNKFKEEGYEDYIIKTIKLLEGPQALIFTDLDQPDVLYFFRRHNPLVVDQRPLYRGQITEDNKIQYYLSSLSNSLKTIGCTNIQEVKEDHLYSYNKNGDGLLNFQKITFEPKEKTFPKTNVIHQTNNFSIIKNNLKDDIIDWEEVLENCIDVYINNENSETDCSITKCFNCFGTGKINTYKCTKCDGSGWLTTINNSNKNVLGFTIQNFNKGDLLLVVSGENKGTLVKFISEDTFNKDKVIVNITVDNNTEYINTNKYMFKSDLVKYKTSYGIIISSLDVLKERYDIKNINYYQENLEQNNLFCKVKEKETTTKKTLIGECKSIQETYEIISGDIILYEDSTTKNLITAEILNYNKTYNLIKVKILEDENKFGLIKEIQFLKDTIYLVQKSTERLDYTVQDISENILIYYPKDNDMLTLCEHFLQMDDDIQKIIEHKSLQGLTVKELCNLKHKNFSFMKTYFSEQLEKMKELAEAM